MRATPRLLGLLLALPATPAVALPDRPDLGWVADGPVNAITVGPDGLVYAGGDFTALAPRTGPLALIGASPAGPRADVTELLGTVLAVRPDDAGGWYVGGDFTVPDAPGVRNLVRVGPDGRIDPAWRPDPDGAVRAIDIVAGVIVAGGDFSRIGAADVPRARIAAIAPNGTVGGWSPGADATVRAIAHDALGNIFVGGDFTQLGGAGRARLGALTLGASSATAWNPGADGPVRAVAVVSPDRILVGGSFASVRATPRARLAALDGGSALLGWNPGASGPVNALAVAAGDAIVGGEFTTLAGAPRNGLGALDVISGAPAAWAPEPDAPVDALAVTSAGAILVGGRFTAIGTQAPRARYRVAAINAVSGAALDWPGAATGPVLALGASGQGSIAVGGRFGGAGGVERRRLAALDPLTGAPTAWAPPIEGGPVRALTVGGGTVFAGGGFSSAGGQPRERLAAIDLATGGVLGWDPRADADVTAILALGSEIYVGGAFTSAGRQARANLAAIGAQSGLATPWNPAPSAEITALGPGPSGGITAAGRFTSIGAQSRLGLALLNPLSGAAEPWNPGLAGGAPLALTTAGGLVVGGDFTGAGAQAPRPARSGLALLDQATGLAGDWNPGATGGQVRALTTIGGEIVAGGSFTTVGGQPRAGLAALAPSGGLATWAPGASAPVAALAASGTSLWVGGSFATTGGRAQQGLASFTTAPLASAPPMIEGRPRTGSSLGCRTGGWSRPSSVATTWLRDGAPVGTGPDYTPVATDAGRSLSCREAATNRGGTSLATAGAVRVEGPLLISPPGLRGRAQVGRLLVCDPGTWAGKPDIAFSWRRGDRVLPGATGRTRRVTWRDFNTRVHCRVRATDASGTAEANSPHSARVRSNPAVPDTRSLRRPVVLRSGPALAVVPRSLPLRSPERPRLVAVVIQSTRAGTVLLRVGGGVQAVRFRKAGIARVRVRAAAAFLPGVRRIPVVLSARFGNTRRVSRGSIRIR